MKSIESSRGTIHRRKGTRVALLLVVCLASAMLMLVPPAPSQAQSNQVRVSAGESIQAALDAAAPGSTIVVEAGVYDEQVRVQKNGIKLLGERGATISPSSIEATNDCAGFANANVAICIGAEFDTPNPNTGLLVPSVTLRNITVSGFTIEGVLGEGIYADNIRNLRITHNVVTGATFSAISVGAADRAIVRRNWVQGGGEIFGAIWTGRDSTRVWIVENVVYDNARSGIWMTSGENVHIARNVIAANCGGVLIPSDGAQNIWIVGNWVVDNSKLCTGPEATIGGYGIAVVAGTKVTVRGNTVESHQPDEATTTPAGILVAQAPGEEPPRNVRVLGNTLTGNVYNSVASDIFAEAAGRLVVRNNTCTASGPNVAWCSGGS